MSSGWTSSDAWVLASIEGGGPRDGYTLAQVIAKADAINHAVPAETELVRAVARLVAAGLVGADAAADRYWLTEAGAALRRRSTGRGLFGWMEALPPTLARLGVPAEGDWSLPPAAFDRALRAYRRRAGRFGRDG